MRRLLELATYLYPAAWRRRYAREFAALLEDVHPRFADVLNVLGGAVKMQLTHGGLWKIAVGFSLAGTLAAGALSLFAMHDKYAATGVFAMPGAATPADSALRIHDVVQHLLSRTVLAEIMMRENLYTAERRREPLEDVIEGMRTRDVRVRALASGGFSIEFLYRDRAQAERTVRDLAARMPPQSTPQLIQLSDKEVTPNRLAVTGMGMGLGLLTGLVIAATLRVRRRTVAITAACGLAGLAIAFGISLAIPNRYISTAVLRIPDAASFEREVLSREELARVIDTHHLYFDQRESKSLDQLIAAMRDRDLRVQRIDPPGSVPAVEISFAYPDRFAAQSVMLDLLRQYREPMRIDVLDGPSLPESPMYPNRYVITILGLALGMVSGGILARARRGQSGEPIPGIL